jgi:hypothetical protein
MSYITPLLLHDDAGQRRLLLLLQGKLILFLS